MVNIEIVGYKKITKNEKTFYHVSAISDTTLKDTVGLTTYNGFISSEHLEKHSIAESSLVGAKGAVYNIKEQNGYKTVISLKKS